jgi:Tol biopolymer transport system component
MFCPTQEFLVTAAPLEKLTFALAYNYSPIMSRPAQMSEILLAIILLILLRVLSVEFVQAQESATVGVGRVAFESDQSGHSDIYVMNADGSHQKQLTRASSEEEENLRPVWSPDCQQIVVTRLWTKPSHRSELYVMAANGTMARPLRPAPAAASDWEPTWSPDGTELAFVSDRGGNPDIYIMRVDGTQVRRLTRSQGRDKHSWNPAWSPRGDTIAFDSNRGGGDEIYEVRVGSGEIRQLTHTFDKTKGNWTPAWSWDGQRIVFSSNRDAISGKLDDSTQFGIYVMDSDGSHLRRLTHWDDVHPKWSPDGSSILFEASRSGRKNDALYVMRADGTHVQCVTPDPSSHRHPDWCRYGARAH